MPFKRQTAKKVRILDIVKGEWVKKEGMEPSYVITPFGATVSRARLLATIVDKFISEDESFASITLDDTSETIRIKTFKTAKPIENFEIGDMVDVIGKVREYNQEIYVIPEVVRKITDYNLENLRRLEIIKSLKGKKQDTKPKTGKDDKEGMRKKILDIIGKSKEPIAFTDLISQAGGNEDLVEKVIDDILAEGLCYEPTPGKIKRI